MIGLLSTAFALGGIGLAFAVYRRGEPQTLPAGVERGVHSLGTSCM